MGLSLGEPIIFDGLGPVIAALDDRRLLVIYSESGIAKIRVVDVISRVVGPGTVLTRGKENADLVGVDNNTALIVYSTDTEGGDPPPHGQFCKAVTVSGTSILGIGSEATISSSERMLTLSKVETEKAIVLYRFDNKTKARMVNISGLTATPQAETTINTGTPGALNIETLVTTGTSNIIASWASGGNRFAALAFTFADTVTIQDQIIMDTGTISLTQTNRGLVTFGDAFAIRYRKGGLATIMAGTVGFNTLAIGSSITGIDGTVMARLPADKFIVSGDFEVNQISIADAVLTDNSVPVTVGGNAKSSSPIGSCVALAFDNSIVMVTQQSQFYQGSGPFGGAERLTKTATLPIPGVRPNAIDVSATGLAVLGANAGAPCQEEEVIISSSPPYATWEDQSRNYPTGSAVTSVKFV